MTESNKDLIRLLTRDNVYSNETHPDDVFNASGVNINDTVFDAKNANKPYKKFTPKNKKKVTKNSEGNKTTTQHVPEITKKHNFAKSKSDQNLKPPHNAFGCMYAVWNRELGKKKLWPIYNANVRAKTS